MKYDQVSKKNLLISGHIVLGSMIQGKHNCGKLQILIPEKINILRLCEYKILRVSFFF